MEGDGRDQRAPTGFQHVADEYDRVGPDYRDSKLLPFRRHVEQPTAFGLLPALEGLRAVDLACGEGIYSRALMRLGARRVVGVDISEEMIALARRAEAVEPLGVEYVTADVARVELDEPCDVALCAFLFNYARSRTELRTLVEAVHRLVRPGGLVVGCNDYPENSPEQYARYRTYGFVKVCEEPRVEGSTITYRFFNQNGSVFEIDNYYLPGQAYRDEFARAGFTTFEWVMPTVSAEGLAAFPPGFWDCYLEDPPMVSFMARNGS